MGLFSQIEDNINNMGGGLFLDIAKLAGKGIKAGAKAGAKLAGEGIKAGTNAVKNAADNAKAKAAEPEVCPHCGQPLR